MFEEHLLLLLSEQFEILLHPLELASAELPYPVSKLEFHSESIFRTRCFLLRVLVSLLH